MNYVEVIREKAEKHKAKYPSFDLKGFLEWIDQKAESWQRWAVGRETSRLNKVRRFERRVDGLLRD